MKVYNTKQSKREAQLKKQEELLKNFVGDFYQEKLVDGVWMVKIYFRPQDRWIVTQFKSSESFNRYKATHRP